MWRSIFAEKKVEQPLTFRIPPVLKKEKEHTPGGSLSAARISKPDTIRPPPQQLTFNRNQSLYSNRLHLQTTETWIISNLGITGNDDTFNQVMPFCEKDLEKRLVGHSIQVTSSVKSVNLRLLLAPSLQNISISGTQTTIAGQAPLTFKSAGLQGEDCQVPLQDAMNSFEIVATGYLRDEFVSQAICLFISRSQQIVPVK